MSSTDYTNRFRLYTGNNLEVLAKAFANARMVHKNHFHKEGFFETEKVCVATQGMRVWLEHYLVEQGHVVAGIQFPFLRDAIDDILKTFMKDNDAYRPELFKEDVLIWRIYRILQGKLPGNLRLLDNYIAKEGAETQDVRRYQLARKLAQIYYDYIAFIPEKLHPEVITQLTEKTPVALPEKDQWQLDLWQLLCEDEKGVKVTSPAEAMLRFMNKSAQLNPDDYAPVTFFGVSAMPPHFLHILKKLSTVQPVNFFYLNHCDDLWDDVKANWEQKKIDLKGTEKKLDDHFIGNSLLGNYGIQGREFFKVMLDEGEVFETHELTELDYDREWEVYASEEQTCGTSLLAEVQNHIKNNQPLQEPKALETTDDSLTIHSCFNEVREVEALQDSLLALLQKYHNEKKDLSMNDIIVMAPDIAKFAPAIQAVFGRGPLRSHYCVSDRSVRTANLLAETFSQILKLEKSRFEISRITALLDSPPLRARFGLEENDMTTLRDWFQKAGIRWGRDRDDRKDEGDFEEYSWQYGLDRLLMKIAVDGRDENGEERQTLGTLSPVDFNSSGDNQELLGGFLRLYQALCDFVDEVQEARDVGKTPAEWCALLKEKRQIFFQPNADTALEYSMLGKALEALEKDTTAAGLAQTNLPFDTLRTALECTLDNPAKGEPFLNGKVTFCSLLPMRGIPCKVIALLGMDVGAFPRPNDATGFNLVARKDDKGDYIGNLLKYYNRSRSIEDRFTFLEALMSARDYMMIFYKGQDDQTLKDLVAAAPVCELRDYLKTICANADGVFIKHRLNAFDPQGFKDEQTEEGKSEVSQRPTPSVITKDGSQYTGILRKPFSFDARMADIANVVKGQPTRIEASMAPPYWIRAYELPIPEDLKDSSKQERDIVIELSELEYFLKNAADMYASRRLGLPKSPWEDPALTDTEPFAVNSLIRSKIKRKLGPIIARESHTQDEVDAVFQSAQSDCLLPTGTMGTIAFNQLVNEAKVNDAQFCREWSAQEASEPTEFNIDLGSILPGKDCYIRTWLKEVCEKYSAPGPDSLLGKMEKNLDDFGKVNYHVTLHGKFRYYEPTAAEPDALPGIRAAVFADLTGSHLIPIFLKHLCLTAKKYEDCLGNPPAIISSYASNTAKIQEMSMLQDQGANLEKLPSMIREAIQDYRDCCNTQTNAAIEGKLAELENFADDFENKLQEIKNGILGTIKAIQELHTLLVEAFKQGRSVKGVMESMEKLANCGGVDSNTPFFILLTFLPYAQKEIKKYINKKGEAPATFKQLPEVLNQWNTVTTLLLENLEESSSFLPAKKEALSKHLCDLESMDGSTLGEEENEENTKDVPSLGTAVPIPDKCVDSETANDDSFDNEDRISSEELLCYDLTEILDMIPGESPRLHNVGQARLKQLVTLYLLNQFYPVPLFANASPDETKKPKQGKAASVKYELNNVNEKLLYRDCFSSDKKSSPIPELQEALSRLACHYYDGIQGNIQGNE